MKKAFQSFVLMWAIHLAVFNVIVFAVRPIIPGYVISYDARFWVSWWAILLAFLGKFCPSFAVRISNVAKSMGFAMSLVTEMYCFFNIFIVSSLIMLITYSNNSN